MAVFDEGLAGCNEESCELPSSVELLELVTYLDEELQVGDREGASEKVGEIVEAAIGRDQQREQARKSRGRRSRGKRSSEGGLSGEPERPDERLF